MPGIDLSKYIKKEPPKPTTSKIDIRSAAAAIVRGASAFSPGGLIGAGIGAAGEGLAQTIEDRESYNFPQIAAQGALGAVPFGKVGSLVRTGVKGGLMGGGGALVTQQAEEGLHTPTEEDIKGIALSTGLGGLTGGIASKLHGRIPNVELKNIGKGKTPKAVQMSKTADAVRQAKDIPNTTSTVAGSREVINVQPGETKIMDTVNRRTKPAQDRIAPERIRTSDPQIGRDVMSHLETNKPIKEPKINMEYVPPSWKEIWGAFKEHPIRQTLAEGRQIQTALDLSAPLRQGITQWTQPEFRKNLWPMIKAAASEDAYIKYHRDIANMPEYPMMQKAGVEFTELGTDVTKREEQLRGLIAEKIPYLGQLFRGSNRAYTTFLNKLRADSFARMSKDALRAGSVLKFQDDVNENAVAIAKFVNDATGRGGLGRWESSAVALNDVFFSPKLIASRLNMLRRAVGATLQNGADDKVAWQLRQEAWSSMAGVGGLAAAAIALSKMNGAEGTDNPKSSDFGKLKLGKTRVDFTGGIQQYIRVAAQIAAAEADIEGSTEERNRLDTGGRFLRNKLSPVASAIVDWMAGENVLGEEFQFDNEAKELITPLIVDDLIEVMREDPSKLPLTIPASIFGAGVQSYGPSESGGGSSMPRIALPRIQTPQIR